MMKLIKATGVAAMLSLFATAVFSQGCTQRKPQNREGSAEWETLNQEAMDLHRAGKYDRAVVVAKKALEVAEKSADKNHPELAESLNNLAELYRAQGQYAEAEPLYKRSLAIREKALGPDHPNVATSLENMAALYRKTGKEKAAEGLEKRAAAIRAVKR